MLPTLQRYTDNKLNLEPTQEAVNVSQQQHSKCNQPTDNDADIVNTFS